MRTVYICGDSFGCTDPESSITPWVELLAEKLPDWTLHNLSLVCASNLHIRLQVDRAIACGANFVIMLATACTRGQGQIQSRHKSEQQLLDRFYKIGKNTQDNFHADLTCYSINSLDSTCVLDPAQIQIVKQFRDSVLDFDLEIYQNMCVIESTLHALESSQIPFVFDQGGFENPEYTADADKKYFKEFDHHRSEINLWSEFGSTLTHRPYFHIIDQQVHERTAKYYASIINACG